MESETLLAVAIMIGATMMAFSIALIILALLIYKIAKLYAPERTQTRRTPPFGHRAVVDDEGIEPAVLQGLNRYPKPTETEDDEPPPETEDVAQPPTVTQVAVAAEGMMSQDRELWWDEQREAGYSDEEIGEMENAGVVPVFEEGS